MAATQGEEIVVTGEGLPETPATPAYGSIVLTRADLEATPSGLIENALLLVAGVQQFRRSDSRSANPTAQGSTLRALGGNATSRSLVLFDGVPVTDPFFGYVPFTALPTAQLGRVAVTRGSGAGPFGAGALAGTVELSSAPPGALPRRGASVFVDDTGASQIEVGLVQTLGGGSAVASVRRDRGPGFWTTPVEQRGTASVRAAYHNASANLRLLVPVGSDFELQGRIAAFRDERTLRFRGADSLSAGQDLSVRLVGRGPWQMDALAYVQARDYANVVVSAATFRPVLVQQGTPSTGLGAKLELRPPLGDDTVMRFGLDLRDAAGQTREEARAAATGLVTERRDAGGRNTTGGVFLEIDRVLGPAVLTAGARLDRFAIADGVFRSFAPDGAVRRNDLFDQRSGWETSVRGGAVIALGGRWHLRAAGYTGFRLPTLNELYRPFAVFPVTTLANPALRNERLRGVEAGLDYRDSQFQAALTVFDNRITDAIANATLSATLRQRINVDGIHAQGVEAQAAYAAAGWRVTASAALTKARVKASGTAAALDGRRPAQTPAQVASLAVARKWAAGHEAVLTLRHVGAQFEDDLGRDRLPAATTVDGLLRVPLRSGVAAVIRLENLLDETVVTRNQAGSIDLGAPRTVWWGLELRR
ncbi:TonB-dependent receptor [Erythrobacteraceae bacterium CFH 75059]|nr:TonB-dependent receptor [Erythrobacteraceae bacterium CFH 75059]